MYIISKQGVFMLSAIKNLIKPAVAVDYMLNDPTNAIMVSGISLQPPKNLAIVVAGFKGAQAAQGTLEAQANNAYITVAGMINYLQNFAALSKWADTNSLKIFPRAGNDLNAYYDRKNLKFFYTVDPKTKKMIYTCDSTDVVAHELGHAMLDCLRPDFWSVQALEIEAFHEGFADCTAMTALLQFPQAIDRVLTETKGDLKKSSILTKLAEQIGIVLYGMTDGATMPYALRDAVNNFKYVNPLSLPSDGPNNILFAESHSFGRLWVGIWYDILVGIYQKILAKNVAPNVALTQARDVAYKYMVLSAKSAPRVTKYFNAVSQMMVKIDKQAGSPYADVLATVFKNRGISIPAVGVSMLSSISLEDIEGRNSINFDHGILVPEKKMVRLGKVIKGVKMLAVDGIDLSNVEIEVASDKFYHTDRKSLVGEIASTEDEQIEAALAAVQNIKEIGSHAMWDVVDNKLTRNWVI